MKQIANPTIASRLAQAVNLDGWVNILTGLGLKRRDKRLAAHAEWRPMDRDEQENLYAGDDIARKVVDIVPDEAMEKGYKITGWRNPKNEEIMQARLRQLRFNEIVNEAWKNDRIHGGSGIFKVCEDGQMDSPMPKRPLLALNIMHRWELQVWADEVNSDVTSPEFGMPMMYRLQLQEGTKQYSEPVHASRIVRFPGVYLPRTLRKQNSWWGDSELNRLKNPIQNYSTSHDSVAATILDFSIPVMKLKDLSQLISSNGDAQVIKRLELTNMSKSVARMIVLDADKEDFDHKTRTVNGLAELIEKVEGRLVTASGIPKTKILGESPKGMSGKGDHEEVNYHSFLMAQQNTYLKPRMLEIIWHIIDTEFPKEASAEIDIEFNPLTEMDEVESSTVRLNQAQTDQIYIANQVVDPREIAESRFGGDKYSTDTKIDMDLRNDPEEEDVNPQPVPEQTDPGEIDKNNPSPKENEEDTKPEPSMDGGPGSGPQSGTKAPSKAEAHHMTANQHVEAEEKHSAAAEHEKSQGNHEVAANHEKLAEMHGHYAASKQLAIQGKIVRMSGKTEPSMTRESKKYAKSAEKIRSSLS